MMKGMHVLMLSLLLFSHGTQTAVAGTSKAEVRKQVESSMVIKGGLDIEIDGTVSAVQIDQQDKIPDGVARFVRDSAMRWEFEPVVRGGDVVRAHAPMSLRVVASKLDNGDYRLVLRGISFDRYDADDPEGLASAQMTPPAYPEAAWKMNASADAYLAVKVGRDGTVEDVVAEQVNLRSIGTQPQMDKLRALFARSAVKAAQAWTFRVPSRGEVADQPYWTVRVPISYSMHQPSMEVRKAIREGRNPDYGHWVSYVPGPRQHVPWSTGHAMDDFAPDTLAEGGVYLASSRSPKLRTPLQPGG